MEFSDMYKTFVWIKWEKYISNYHNMQNFNCD